MPTVILVAAALIALATSAAAEQPQAPAPVPAPRWILGEGCSTVWMIADDRRLPHQDFIEQGGRLAGQVVSYAVAADGALTVSRSVVWPALRIFPNNTHGSLIHRYGSEAEPAITIAGAPLGAIAATAAILDGTLTLRGRAGHGIEIERCSFPCTAQPATIERWRLRNAGSAAVELAVAPLARVDLVRGPHGVNVMEVTHDAPAAATLAPGGELTFAVTFSARLASQPAPALDAAAEEAGRRAYAAGLQRALRLETPDPVLDRAFAFAKLRVAESINATRGGLMLAPGGLTFYAATWCNDNVEYAGPFFPFLGDPGGDQASLDTYRQYRAFMGPDYHRIPSSIIAEGTDIWEGAGDRGDAAMYAYGCARFCLARGDRAIAAELWPAIAWCLEYCRRQTTPAGVIASDCDELENRLPAGKANLSTASLCYGGLRSAADLARALGKQAEADEYGRRADALADAIDGFFGATVQGFATYRYYEGNDVLRSWICLPLCMGIATRRDATIAALFSPRLWTVDGLASQAGDRTFWDRSTLYALRGVFQAGETATALRFLTAFTQRRLLGEHVPYPVEAWPEGGQRQLASESGLYCRIVTEGMFGILPTGLDRFRCTPRLPDGWPRMALRSVRAFGHDFDLVVERQGAAGAVTVVVSAGGRELQRTVVPASGSVEVQLP
jgi:hypothetical protein